MDEQPGNPASGSVDGSEPNAPQRQIRIDVAPSLHEAGHEVHDLGFEGIPDDGPVLHADEDEAAPEDPLDFVIGQTPSD